jgi:hypothetical protein
VAAATRAWRKPWLPTALNAVRILVRATRHFHASARARAPAVRNGRTGSKLC